MDLMDSGIIFNGLVIELVSLIPIPPATTTRRMLPMMAAKMMN